MNDKTSVTNPTPALYPLRFREILRNYTFGGRWIPRAFPAKSGLPQDQRIAETWEVCDWHEESSVVRDGALTGKTLHELIALLGESVLGTRVMEAHGGRFPLIIKLLDATAVLSEQVHHSDELAAKLGLPDPGKTEAWYMLDVVAGSAIHCGARAGLNMPTLRRAVLDGRAKEYMSHQDVKPGDAFLLYAGTMHFSEGGQLFYEVMQNSDVYAGLAAPRAGLAPAERERIADEAIQAVAIEPAADFRATPLEIPARGGRRVMVLACRYFALERLEPAGAMDVSPDGHRFVVLTQIAGNAVVGHGGVQYPLAPGQSIFLPASLRDVTLEGQSGSATLNAYVPDLVHDIIRPARGAGHSHRTISGLGGHTRQNDLARLLEIR